MTAQKNRKSTLLTFLLGAFSVVIIFMLTGASSHSPVGRYDMEVITTNGRTSQIYVIDTSTGQVKWLDSLNTPFQQVKGE